MMKFCPLEEGQEPGRGQGKPKSVMWARPKRVEPGVSWQKVARDFWKQCFRGGKRTRFLVRILLAPELSRARLLTGHPGVVAGGPATIWETCLNSLTVCSPCLFSPYSCMGRSGRHSSSKGRREQNCTGARITFKRHASFLLLDKATPLYKCFKGLESSLRVSEKVWERVSSKNPR